jgi:hypothetical protein
MRQRSGVTLLWWFGVVAALGSGLACGSKGGDYIGRWECASGGDYFFEIKDNNNAFLVTDESGDTYPASMDEQGTLVVSGVPLMGSVPLPIDSDSGELICSACDCNRYTKKSAAEQAEEKSDPVSDEEAQKQTVADIKNVGTAMFSWLTDQVSAGAAGQSQAHQFVDITRYSLISHEDLNEILVPRYLQEIPTEDGWGHPYEFYLGVDNVTSPQVMSIRSAGRDGRFSSTNYSVGSFASNDFAEDIVWADGYFVRWPQGHN